MLWLEVVFYDGFVSQEIKSYCVSNNKGQIKKFPFLSLYKFVQVSIVTFTKFAQFFYLSTLEYFFNLLNVILIRRKELNEENLLE